MGIAFFLLATLDRASPSLVGRRRGQRLPGQLSILVGGSSPRSPGQLRLRARRPPRSPLGGQPRRCAPQRLHRRGSRALRILPLFVTRLERECPKTSPPEDPPSLSRVWR